MSTPATTPAPQKKSLMDTVFTSTPVIMTIVATVLAGLSSSEMTLAQYHRSLAAQNQSKAGDQWNFFQAKRTQGKEMASATDLLRGLGGAAGMSSDGLEATTKRLHELLLRCQKDAALLQQTLAKTDANGAGAVLAGFQQTLEKKVAEFEKQRKQLAEALGDPGVKSALPYLLTAELPKVQDRALEDDNLKEAVKQIKLRKTEIEMATLVVDIDQKALAEAIKAAEDNAAAFDLGAKPISESLDRVGRIVAAQVAAARAVARAGQELDWALGDLPKVAPGFSTAALGASIHRLEPLAANLLNDFIAARDDYTIRRYEKEARYNQAAAELYEVQVRKSGITSERHRTRSKNFFYGMLAAQAGVTIASLSLAVRKKSILWSLAGLAGLGAVIFGGYVYLYM
jgi:hypothetical protein